ETSELPCMIYNIPGRTGVRVPPQVIRTIAGHRNFWSVKEASGSIREYQQFRQEVPEVPLFSGDDGLLPYFAAAGCRGLISVASNVWPEATGRYVEICLNGDPKQLFPLWKRATEILFSASNPIPAKSLLREKGLIKTSVLRPPLTDRELDNLEELLNLDNEISNWLLTQK
ncbi:MAG: dihydrodipicolinate synthase family protein, partial [Balneolaceae bacterium]